MNNEFFIRQLSKEFKISERNTKRLLNKVAKQIKKERKVSKNFIARTIIHYLRKIRQEEETIFKEHLLSKFKHKHLKTHYEKFIELYRLGWGAKRIENYFKNNLKKEISKAYLDKVLKYLRDKEKENG